ncbi:polysaccharide biosynthesis/export family protein [Thiomicrorhabdus sp.]|uniref:polysaccharide biosynthesis/export family protein n=1 Tax=Thiomicrorhabdus sp. TaxID=2039724 RepID=UPI0029C60840|nr:polysaccharide biosynthesis/export family protein [Thiomicrorhabdus sp.]
MFQQTTLEENSVAGVEQRGSVSETIDPMMPGRPIVLKAESEVKGSITVISKAQYDDEMRLDNKILPGERVTIMVYNQSSTETQKLTSMITTRGGSTTNSSLNSSDNLGILVSKDGSVRLPLIGKVKISDMTEDEASQYLDKLYQQYLREPYVTVQLTNQRIFVLGEVAKQGVVQITNGTMSLIEAIARSNGLTDYAQRTNIKILRGDLRNPEIRVVDLTKMDAIRLTSLVLQPNDIVYVQPRSMKGYNMAFGELSPPFKLLASILQPFVNITYLKNNL